jgi:hypothetical protein
MIFWVVAVVNMGSGDRPDPIWREEIVSLPIPSGRNNHICTVGAVWIVRRAGGTGDIAKNDEGCAQ